MSLSMTKSEIFYNFTITYRKQSPANVAAQLDLALVTCLKCTVM